MAKTSIKSTIARIFEDLSNLGHLTGFSRKVGFKFKTGFIINGFHQALAKRNQQELTRLNNCNQVVAELVTDYSISKPRGVDDILEN